MMGGRAFKIRSMLTPSFKFTVLIRGKLTPLNNRFWFLSGFFNPKKMNRWLEKQNL